MALPGQKWMRAGESLPSSINTSYPRLAASVHALERRAMTARSSNWVGFAQKAMLKDW